MQIVDTVASHRAITLQPSESLDSRTVAAAFVSKGYSEAVAEELASTMFDAFEEAGLLAA